MDKKEKLMELFHEYFDYINQLLQKGKQTKEENEIIKQRRLELIKLHDEIKENGNECPYDLMIHNWKNQVDIK